jgi:hypothetical protein
VSIDHDYFLKRAEEEADRAAAADDARAKDAHFRLSEFYRDAAQKRAPSLEDYKTALSEFYVL